MISEKIKQLRKQAKLSQEQMAEKINVSRQAVTKWETNLGIPDVENLRSISKLFGISLDALMDNNLPSPKISTFLYESFTEYDMEAEKNYDIIFSGAKEICVTTYNGEKIKIKLASNTMSDIQSTFKVKIDDIRKRIDIDIKRFGKYSEANAKEELYIFIMLPQSYTQKIEISGNTKVLKIDDMKIRNFEFNGKVSIATLSNVWGHIELNSNQDLLVECDSINGRIDINQISATSRIRIPKESRFIESLRGVGNHIYYEYDSTPCDSFALTLEEAKNCENIIELNGIKSELVIETFDVDVENPLCKNVYIQ